MKPGYTYLFIFAALILLGVGSASVYTGHPDGNWLVAPGLLILIVLGLGRQP